MDHQHLLPNNTPASPSHEIKETSNPNQEKTGLLRHDEITTILEIEADTNPNPKCLSGTILPPTPDTSPDMSCDIETFQAQSSQFRQDEMMPSQLHLDGSKDLFDTFQAQDSDASTPKSIDLPLNPEPPSEDEPHKKRPRVDSLLPPYSTPASEEVLFASKNTEEKPFKAIHEVWTEEEENMINQPYNYLMSHSGKDIRKQILAAFNVWLKIDARSLDIINRVVGMLHNASLLIDDIQDSSPLRRGAPSAHLIHGTPSTINSANYMYIQAMSLLSTLPAAHSTLSPTHSTLSPSHSTLPPTQANPTPTALQIYIEEMLNLHRGQGLDLHWRDTFTLPTEAAYLKMVSNKTGGLFRLAIRLMCLVSREERGFDGAVACLVEKLGLIFQIRDDFVNLVSDVYTSQKGPCEDLTEGKFSFPIIHAIHHSPSDSEGDNNNNAAQKILHILSLKTTDPALKDFVIDYMRNTTKTFDYTRAVLRNLDREARVEMGRFGNGEGNLLLAGLLDRLVV